MCTSSSSQLSSGFDWSEEGSVGEKTQNNKRQHEDDDESNDSETEVSEQVMRVQVNCALIERGMKLCVICLKVFVLSIRSVNSLCKTCNIF